MSGSQRGFTLIELMISVAILAIFSSVALGLGVQARQEHRLVTAYQQDVRECRAALRSLERDVRAASRVAVANDQVELTVGDERIVYSVVGGDLRVICNGEQRVLARCIENLQVSADEALVTVALELRPRAHAAKRGAARVSTSVVMRNFEGER